jgi:hypothetical protein
LSVVHRLHHHHLLELEDHKEEALELLLLLLGVGATRFLPWNRLLHYKKKSQKRLFLHKNKDSPNKKPKKKRFLAKQNEVTKEKVKISEI